MQLLSIAPTYIIAIIVIYFSILMLVSHLTSKKNDNNTFFSGNNKSPWYIVAFGMIGATISGISLISVPGMVENGNWHYLQTCFGFFFGYIIVAYVLLPLYYKLNLISIYEYLNQRFGSTANKTGSTLFVVAKLISSATKLYIVILLLQEFIFNYYNIPFWLTSSICVLLIWLYTRKSGIQTIVWTDTFQTFFMIISLVVIGIESYKMVSDMGFNFFDTITTSSFGFNIFNFSDWKATSHFVKQFFSGIFIVIVMTGLDQDMMQKNLSIRTLKESQRNMISYGAAFIPVNAILLFIGTLMLMYYNGQALPAHGDKLLISFVQNSLSPIASLCLIIGVISATFSSADSALTSITTTIAIDIVKAKNNNINNIKTRKIIHLLVCLIFTLLVIMFDKIQSKSILDTIFTIVGYAYGPLLGLFCFGLLTKKQVHAIAIPLIAIVSPILCYVINIICINYLDYYFGYELLMLNGFITFVGLYLSSFNIKGSSKNLPKELDEQSLIDN